MTAYLLSWCSIAFDLICNMTTFRKRYSFTFWPHPWVEGVFVGKIFPTMLLPASSALIWYATWLLSENYIVWPFDPNPWVNGVSVGKILATMLLPASSDLIWYATWPYSEKKNWPWPRPLSPPKDSDPGLQTEIPFDMFHIYYCAACMQNFSKNINNCLSYCEIKIFDLWPLRWGQRGWGKTLTLPCLSTSTWQSWSIVRSCWI